MKTYYLLLFGTVTLYFAASKYLFDKVYETSQVVIDELFHTPQGLAYCNNNFKYWDPKITTLPGLYLVSAAVLGTYFRCNKYNLRFVNLIASCINLMLFSSMLKFVYKYNTDVMTVLQALNLAILPPLYFFSHVYYSDTMSMMFTLAFFRLCFNNKYKFSMLMLGLFSILMRQTNVAWIALVFGTKFLEIFIKSSRVFENKLIANTRYSPKVAKDYDISKWRRYYSISDVYIASRYHVSTCFNTFFRFLTLQDILVLITHVIILISFLAFVYINGSIVLGDKEAHEATIHIPQMFYFLLFYGVFGLPHILNKIPATFMLIINNKTNIVLLTILFGAIVHYNTIVHPYLLADNRHYTFYIWNRWFLKYSNAIYSSIPVYIFLLCSLYANLKNQNCISFLLPFSISLFLVLSLQKMVEVRYFLIPFIILRMRFEKPSLLILVFEFVWYVAINVVTFYLFFNKEIVWKDFDDVQRIIW